MSQSLIYLRMTAAIKMMTRLPSIRFSSSMKNGTFFLRLRKSSENAVLTDRLDRFLRTIDVVPACLLQVSAVVRHELHLHAVLERSGSEQTFHLHKHSPGPLLRDWA